MIHQKQLESAALAAEVEKFLAKGGKVKQIVNEPVKVKHGTSDQYKKRSCRCEKCMAWALKTGVIKTTKLKGTKA
ncbi:hypothetical protein [Acinetobacter larvae]|uniref:Transcriptional regulator SutA RNAP-binding domain-containing protein n=1 Tax=Acinetobacter larvae TaxID=1789224 RepID=A0A1B2LZG3_9GAMM|nr:hypothetical protein [Acinetobacter larvae]AOA58307.1 hypothetical protein BFG52_08000 [Acinetobacter larvae]